MPRVHWAAAVDALAWHLAWPKGPPVSTHAAWRCIYSPPLTLPLLFLCAGIAKAIAEAAGKDAEIVLYDPKALKLGKGEGFPFRWARLAAGQQGVVWLWDRGKRRSELLTGPLCVLPCWARQRSITEYLPGHHSMHSANHSQRQVLLCRAVHFFASADKAKRVLGWKPQHNFLKDVNQVHLLVPQGCQRSCSAPGTASQHILLGTGATLVFPPAQPTFAPHPHPRQKPNPQPLLHPLAPLKPPQLVSDYKASGRLSKDIDFSADDRILAAVGKVGSAPFCACMASFSVPQLLAPCCCRCGRLGGCHTRMDMKAVHQPAVSTRPLVP